MDALLFAVGYIIAAPVVGGLLAGVDRRITARMQSRQGPPLFQPFYDVFKLFQKERLLVHRSQTFYSLGFLFFMIISGAIFFAGGNLLLCVFAMTTASISLVVGAYATKSPYSAVGAHRELTKMMAYEPMLIITVIGMYMGTKSFLVADLAMADKPLWMYLPGILAGFLFILTIKLQKSPFDLSMSHHGHQELVKGITTEFSGSDLAMIEIAHWYENVLLLGIVYLFFANNIPLAIGATLAIYFLEILIDNVYARLTWRYTVASSWLIALIFGVGNIVVLDVFFR